METKTIRRNPFTDKRIKAFDYQAYKMEGAKIRIENDIQALEKMI